MDLLQKFFTNMTSVDSKSRRPTLVSTVGTVDIIITEDMLTYLFELSSTGHEYQGK